MTDCTSLLNPQIWDVVWCSLQLATGSALLAAILGFILLVYAMYTMRVPVMVAAIMSIMLIFVFAGAGVMANALASPFFTNLMWLVIVVFGVIVVLVFWRLNR